MGFVLWQQFASIATNKASRKDYRDICEGRLLQRKRHVSGRALFILLGLVPAPCVQRKDVTQAK